jgi:hypothetical protein
MQTDFPNWNQKQNLFLFKWNWEVYSWFYLCGTGTQNHNLKNNRDSNLQFWSWLEPKAEFSPMYMWNCNWNRENYFQNKNHTFLTKVKNRPTVVSTSISGSQDVYVSMTTYCYLYYLSETWTPVGVSSSQVHLMACRSEGVDNAN